MHNRCHRVSRDGGDLLEAHNRIDGVVYCKKVLDMRKAPVHP